MSFINPTTEFRRHEIGESIHLGTVTANDDPLRLSRVRVRVPEIHGTLSRDSQLPWATPLRPANVGGSDTGSYSTPEVGSRVLITFHQGSVYSPLYHSAPLSMSEHWTETDTNYPNRYGFRDSTGTRIVIDKESNTVEARHSTGTRLTIAGDGSVSVNVEGNLTWVVDGNWSATASSFTWSQG